MRKSRLKAPSEHPAACYHCISRVVDRQFVLGEEEKEQFVFLLHEYARFCGVRLITYCVMSNHFHVLVEVPARPSQPLSDEALMERLEALSGMSQAGSIRQQLETFRKRNQHKAAEQLRERIQAGMWDLSAFMKLVKQRFTQWHNRRHDRKGTLWEERFKSVLVEAAGETLATSSRKDSSSATTFRIANVPLQGNWSWRAWEANSAYSVVPLFLCDLVVKQYTAS